MRRTNAVIDGGDTGMANCTACGAELKDGVRFCPECGSSVEKKAAPERKQSIYQQPAGVQAAPPQPQMQYQTY